MAYNQIYATYPTVSCHSFWVRGRELASFGVSMPSGAWLAVSGFARRHREHGRPGAGQEGAAVPGCAQWCRFPANWSVRVAGRGVSGAGCNTSSPGGRAPGRDLGLSWPGRPSCCCAPMLPPRPRT